MEILVLDTIFESVAIVDALKSMIWTDRYNAYGDFEMYLSMDANMFDYLRQDYYFGLSATRSHINTISQGKILWA